jgi:subtilisin family serine protease
MLVGAACLWAPPALASDWSPSERAALRAALEPSAGAARAEPPPLPLPVGESQRPAAVAAVAGPTGRVLIGARSHEDLASLARTVARFAPRPETFASIAVIAADPRSPAALAAALRNDARVAYVEPDRKLRIAADPFDAVDIESGRSYTWAFDAVRAGAAIAAAGGGSRREIAVVDTGADVDHPDLAGRLGARYDTLSGGTGVLDQVGHGTFVAGLLSAVDGNGHGGKGVAGNTTVLPIRASLNGDFTITDLARGIRFAVRRRADVINLSLAGSGFTRSQTRVLDSAFFAGSLPVAASGNQAEAGNPLEFPAAAIGGRRGGRGIGLSVAAVGPDGAPASFSAHNSFVSVAAPGAAPRCRHGVFSALPDRRVPLWDDPGRCARTFRSRGARYGYAQGTSFAAPIAAGIASLVWQVERKLESDQVGDVVARSARQTLGRRRWNEFTGTGTVDGAAAVRLARRYDTTAPRAFARARRTGPGRVEVAIGRTDDRTERRHERAGGVRYSLLVSTRRRGGFRFVVRPRARPFRRTVTLRGSRTHRLAVTACDRNGNCGLKRLGRFGAR